MIKIGDKINLPAAPVPAPRRTAVPIPSWAAAVRCARILAIALSTMSPLPWASRSLGCAHGSGHL